MAKSFKIATNEFINKTLGGKLKTADKTLKDPLKCPTYDELKRGVNFVYTDGTTLGIQWRGTVNGEDYTGEYDSDRCLAEIDIEKLNSHDFKIYTNSGHTKTSMSADCMTTAEDISGKTRYEADRLNENFIYPVYSQSGDVKWHEYDDSDENVKQKTVTVNLSQHGSWITYSKNPDSTSYNAYMSDKSHNVDNGYDVLTISLSTGFTDFTIYIRSYAEAGYDFTIAGQIDSSIPTSNKDTGNSKANTSNSQTVGTDRYSYTEVEYTNIDSSKEHTIWVMYSKDGGSNYGDDRGYVLIPKSQNNDYIIKEGKDIGDLNVANITHSGAVPTSSCTFTYKNEKGNVDTIKERWDVSSKKYTLTGIYKGLTANTVNITQSGETYGYYADSAHTKWVSANTLYSNSQWWSNSVYDAYLADNYWQNKFYGALQKQYGWLNDFGDNSGTTNGRDEYNIDTINYSSGTTLTWGGQTNVNVVNAKKDFDNNNSDIMGETIPSADTNNNTYHMAFSNDMWYSGTTLPTTIDNKHDFYWIFLDEYVVHDFGKECHEYSQSLRGDDNTTNKNYSINYYRRYFKPLHCYGKTSIDRMYKYGTTTYDKGTTNLKWLQGKYPKHFKRAVLLTRAQIDPYDTDHFTTEINKLNLNSHVIMLEEQNNWTYSASTKVKAISGSNNYSTVASTSDESYTFRPRFIMMSPEQYSADTNGVFGQIVSGQELSYNEHISGDSYDYNIKKDNPNNITKESTSTPFVSYKGTFTGEINCSCVWPHETFWYPIFYRFKYKKNAVDNKIHYLSFGYEEIDDFSDVKNLIENELRREKFEFLTEHRGYTYNSTDGYKSSAIQHPSGTTNGVSFTNEAIIKEDIGYYYDGYEWIYLSSYTYTLTSNTTINEYVTSPGTILKINYLDGTNIETEIVGSTGTTINVNTRIDTGREITSIDYTAITNYEYAINGTNRGEVSVKYATFVGLQFYAYDPNDSNDVPYYSIEKQYGVDDSIGSTTLLSAEEKRYETGEIKLINEEEISRELKVYLNNKQEYNFIFNINANNANKYNDFHDFIFDMITDNTYMQTINENTYWRSKAWDNNTKFLNFNENNVS